MPPALAAKIDAWAEAARGRPVRGGAPARREGADLYSRIGRDLMTDEVFERLERVEVQRADYIRVLSSHTAAIAANTGTLANMQQMLGQLVAEVAAVRQDVTGVAGRLESLEDRFDRLDAFLRSKLNGGERC
jgi:hypothetical protein